MRFSKKKSVTPLSLETLKLRRWPMDNGHSVHNGGGFQRLKCFNPTVDKVRLGNSIENIITLESDAGGQPFLADERIKKKGIINS